MPLICYASLSKDSVVTVTEYAGNELTAPFACVVIEVFNFHLPGGTGRAVARAICEATGATYTFQDYRNG